MKKSDIELNQHIANRLFAPVFSDSEKNEDWGADIVRSRFPVSFIYGGKHLSELLKSWELETKKTKLDQNTDIITCTLSNPETGLKVEVRISVFNDTPGLDWTVCFQNTGDKNTPILENILPLDSFM